MRRRGFPIQGSLSSGGGQSTNKKTDRREIATDGGGYREEGSRAEGGLGTLWAYDFSGEWRRGRKTPPGEGKV